MALHVERHGMWVDRLENIVGKTRHFYQPKATGFACNVCLTRSRIETSKILFCNTQCPCTFCCHSYSSCMCQYENISHSILPKIAHVFIRFWFYPGFTIRKYISWKEYRWSQSYLLDLIWYFQLLLEFHFLLKDKSMSSSKSSELFLQKIWDICLAEHLR